MKRTFMLFSAAIIAASALSAHANQADRRSAMKQIAASAKAISKGTDVAANAQTIADLASQIPVLFETNEITGDSTALPAIWDNYDDFTTKGAALENAALAVLAAANSGGDVAGSAKAMGAVCGSCHKSYKTR